ncbi:MAG: putative tyrosine-protein kinase [Bacteroidota bacterium]|jgi:capsular exopolysaccharide synthesis family protein
MKTIKNYWKAISTKWHWMLFTMITVFVVAGFYLFVKPTVYQSTAVVKIDLINQSVNNNVNAKDIAAEVETIKSKSLFEKALATTDFDVAYFIKGNFRNTEIYNHAPFTIDSLITKPGFDKRAYYFQYLDASHFSINYSTPTTDKTIVATFGKVIKDDGCSFVVNKSKNKNYFNEYEWGFNLYSNAALSKELYNANYKVITTNDRPNANVVKVSYTHPVPEKASVLVNAIVNTYIDQINNDNHSYANNTNEYLDDQLADFAEKLHHSTKQINQFKSNNDFMDLYQSSDATYKTLGQLEVQNVDINLKLTSLDRLSEYLRHSSSDSYIAPDLEEIKNNAFGEAINRFNQNLREKKKLTALGNTDQLAQVQTDIDAERAFLVECVNNTRKKLILQKQSLTASINSERASVGELPNKQNKLQSLSRDYYLNERIYNFLADKKAQLVVLQNPFEQTNKFIESAEPAFYPEEKTSPLFFILVMVAALVLGSVAAKVAYAKRKIQSPADLRDQKSIPFIGQVEILQDIKGAYQSFTALSTKIQCNLEEGKNQIITVTSSRKGEGKTFIASHIARTLAAQHKKVLLIDANTFNPKLHELFSMEQESGLTDYYSNKAAISDCVHTTSIDQLDILPAGLDTNPVSHLISSDKTKSLLDQLSPQYDAIVIDTPEVEEHIDAIPFMKWSDMNLFVVKSDTQRAELIEHAEILKEEYRLKEVNFLLNAMKKDRNHIGFMRNNKEYKIKGNKYIPRIANLFVW